MSHLHHLDHDDRASLHRSYDDAYRHLDRGGEDHGQLLLSLSFMSDNRVSIHESLLALSSAMLLSVIAKGAK